MPFYNYLKEKKIINLKARDKESALKELAHILLKAEKIRIKKPVINNILKQEESASTFIGHGVAIPYTTGFLKRSRFAIVVGRSLEGINYDAARGAQAHIIALVIAKKEDDNDQIELRSEVASFFKSDAIREKVLSEEYEDINIMDLVSSNKKSRDLKKEKTSSKTKDVVDENQKINPIISSAVTLAREVQASAIVFLADSVPKNDFLDSIKTKKKVIIITSNKSRFEQDDKRFTDLVYAPSFRASRTGQIKTGVLLAISRALLKKSDKIVCVSGNSITGGFDTIVVLDIEKEYKFFFSTTKNILPSDVKPEVLERVLGLASEIAIEGREGKPMGTIFVVGDTNSVNANITQLIINPFRGCTEAERNILDPGINETIKEFASIDGAFIITGDGIVLSAGSYLRPQIEPGDIGELPSGLGTRHASAAGITVCTNALAITVSESTGLISIFKNGKIMLTIQKPVIGNVMY